MKLNLSFSKSVVILCCLSAAFVSSCKKEKPVQPDEDKKPKSIVYFGSHNKDLYALNAETGDLLWKYETSIGGFQYSTPVVADGILYAGSTDHNYYAFDAETGAVKWKFETGGVIESPATINNGIIYFGSCDDSFYAVNAKTGVLVWKFTTMANVSTKPIIVDGTVYFASSDSNVYALDALTGAKKWSYSTFDFIVFSSPLYSKGLIYIGGRSGKLYAINAISGKLKDKFRTNGPSLEYCTPGLNNGVIYINSSQAFEKPDVKGSLYAISENTGRLLWEKFKGFSFYGSPYVTDNYILASASVDFFVLNRVDGSIKWQKEILPNGSMPVLTDNTIYTGGARFFYALDAETGKVRWKYPLPNALSTSKPCLTDVNGNMVN